MTLRLISLMTLMGLSTTIVLGQNPPQQAQTPQPLAPQSPQAPPPKLDEPLVGLGFQIRLGNYWNYVTKEQKFFGNLSYKGATLWTRGAAPDPTEIGKDPIDFGDQPLSVSLENGSTKIGGTLLQSLNATPLNFKNGLGERFRLIAGIDSQTEKDKQSTYRVGLEYSPKISGMALSRTSNTDGETFLAYGFSGEHRSDPNGQSTDIAAAIYRGRIGFGIDYSLSDRKLQRLRQYLIQAKALTTESLPDFAESLLAAPQSALHEEPAIANWLGLLGLTLKDAKEKLNDPSIGHIRQLPVKDRQILLDSLVATLSGPIKEYEAAIADPSSEAASKLRNRLRPNQPRFAIFAEFDGSYSLSHEVLDRKFRSIYSGNARFYFDAAKPEDGYLSLRYENGFSRAEPDKRTNSLVLMFGKSF